MTLWEVTDSHLYPVECWDLSCSVFEAKTVASCICKSLACCFDFFLLLHYFLKAAPIFNSNRTFIDSSEPEIWLFALADSGLSPQQWKSTSMSLPSPQWQLRWAADQVALPARACIGKWDRTYLLLHIVLANVTAFVWINFCLLAN